MSVIRISSVLTQSALHNLLSTGYFARSLAKMVDPKRVLSYEDMLKIIHQPEKVIIDVRNPDEVKSTGKIPSSINIPLHNVQDVLKTMSEEEFKKQFQRPKPSSSDELIFYCQSGRRSTEALDKALKLGYSKVVETCAQNLYVLSLLFLPSFLFLDYSAYCKTDTKIPWIAKKKGRLENI